MMTVKRFLTTFFLLLFCLIGSRAYAADAKALLLGMAENLAAAKQFSVTMNMSYDAVQKSGQKIEFGETRNIVIQRPNHLRVDARQSDGDESYMVFDGKTIALCSRTENVYSLTPYSGDVNSAIRYAGGRMGIRIPLARMLVTTLARELKQIMGPAEYVEKDVLGKLPLDHIAVRSDAVDLQAWIGADKLPRRIVLTYKNEPGKPQFRADFTNWNLTPKIGQDTFVFTPPEGAEKIPTLLPKIQSNTPKNKKGGAQ